ncbi:MAG: hypothetical protein HWE35_14450 [Rhodobacteraceae bacterium]|nr:hypothetical protein [Paracoccaceae bacterium]
MIVPVEMDEVAIWKKWQLIAATQDGVTRLYRLDGTLVPGTAHTEHVRNNLYSVIAEKTDFVAMKAEDGIWRVMHHGINPILDEEFTQVRRESGITEDLYHFEKLDGALLTLDDSLNILKR